VAKINASIYPLLKEAPVLAYWHKADLRPFLEKSLDERALVAELDWAGYKRTIVQQLMDTLAQNQRRYFEQTRPCLHRGLSGTVLNTPDAHILNRSTTHSSGLTVPAAMYASTVHSGIRTWLPIFTKVIRRSAIRRRGNRSLVPSRSATGVG
jgi:hypothetical protein